MADPTTGEWVVAASAAALVVVVLALHLLRPALSRSPASNLGRVAGAALACLAVGAVLAAGITAFAASRADDVDLAAPFGAVLVDAAPADAAPEARDAAADRAERVAAYVVALLLPLAAVVAVLAVAVVDLGRPSGMRIAAGIAAGVVLTLAGLVVGGDVGPAATGAGWGALVLAAMSAVLLVADEVAGRRSV